MAAFLVVVSFSAVVLGAVILPAVSLDLVSLLVVVAVGSASILLDLRELYLVGLWQSLVRGVLVRPGWFCLDLLVVCADLNFFLCGGAGYL